jgi:hypothetical protein
MSVTALTGTCRSQIAATSPRPATKLTVSKWRGRFVRDRLDGLLDAPRSGAPRTIDDARVEAVVNAH